jgi:hypothetical protein
MHDQRLNCTRCGSTSHSVSHCPWPTKEKPMSHTRDDRVYLEADQARCEPENVCPRRHDCARYRAPLPAFGAKMIGAGLGSGWCGWFAAIKPAQASQPVQRRVHPPFGNPVA